MSLSFLPPSSSAFVSSHAHGFSRQMQNPLLKSHELQPALALVSGNDGTFELTVNAVKLGFVVDDVLVEISILYNIGLETPVISTFDHIKEDEVRRGQPLKGLMDPVSEGLRRVSCVLGHCIDLTDMGEVVRAIFC